jgi:hypothetical protein
VSAKLSHLSAGFAAATIRARRGSASTSDMSEPGSGECLRDASSAALRPVLRRQRRAATPGTQSSYCTPAAYSWRGVAGVISPLISA